MQLKK